MAEQLLSLLRLLAASGQAKVGVVAHAVWLQRWRDIGEGAKTERDAPVGKEAGEAQRRLEGREEEESDEH